jgi:hypothetical protein
MGDTYTSIFFFVVITLIYYTFLKPKTTLEVIEGDQESQEKFHTVSRYYLFGYALFVIIIQFLINAYQLVSSCGGDLGSNFSAAATLTVIPWVIIFGTVIILLMMFPGFKSAFSNVIGYFAVAQSANNIFAELLENTDLQEQLDQAPNADPKKKTEMEKAAETIIKICGDSSIIINQMVPENFEEFWSLLTPLMKPENKMETPKHELKEQLLQLVVTKDNIGEAMWFAYTALLLITVINYNMTARGCKLTPEMQKKKHDEFLKEEEEREKENQIRNSTVYSG